MNRVVPDAEFEPRWTTGREAGVEVARDDEAGQGRDVPPARHAFEDALDFLRSQLSLAFTTEDIQEGVKAFFEKRAPHWTGR